MEQYTIIERYQSPTMICPLGQSAGDYECGKKCFGPSCMGWVNEIDEHGMLTGRGRCGMVQSKVSNMCEKKA